MSAAAPDPGGSDGPVADGPAPGAAAARAPRIEPGGRREVGLVNWLIASVMGRVMGTGPPGIATTIGRHRGLLRRWLMFASALMPGGRLPRADTELVILRVAELCDCPYERHHHVPLARRAGLTDEQIERVAQGPQAEGWSDRQRALLAAADELHERRRVSDDTWARLAAELGERELIELVMLVGHYEMVAMTLNSLRVPLDKPTGRRSILQRFG